MIPEMVALFNKALNPGGTMLIHDAELLTMVNLTSQLEPHEAKGRFRDQRGRMLLTLYKK
jgi:hypothetical protein